MEVVWSLGWGGMEVEMGLRVELGWRWKVGARGGRLGGAPGR